MKLSTLSVGPFLRTTSAVALGVGISWTATGAPRADDATWQDKLEILRHMELVHLDDGHGNPLRTIRITSANLQLVNGLGATNGYPDDPSSDADGLTATNGLGNLIVGYADPHPVVVDDRTGSHNVVVGGQHTYTSYAGLVVGRNNQVRAPLASITAGDLNSVWGRGASAGGHQNVAAGDYASARGGRNNIAEGEYASISGGRNGRAPAEGSAISGGLDGVAEGKWSSVSGGHFSTASGERSAVAGGLQCRATGTASFAAGGQLNEANGYASAVHGGQENVASGVFAVVGGGRLREASGSDDWAAGSLWEDD